MTCDIMAHAEVFQCPSNIPSDYKEIVFDTLCKMKDHVEARGPRYDEKILFQSRYYILHLHITVEIKVISYQLSVEFG